MKTGFYQREEGWGWPGRSRKAHYFFKGQSLCRAWLYTGGLHDDANYSLSEEERCKACKKKLAKRQKASQMSEEEKR